MISHDAQAEQIRLAYRQAPIVVAGSLAGGILMIAILWEKIPHAWLVSWFSFLVTFNGVALTTLYLLHQRFRPPVERENLWGLLFSSLAGMTGVIWGLAGVFFFVQGSLEYQLILFFFLFTATAAVMSGMIPYKPAFVAFVTPTLLLLAARSFVEGDLIHIALGLAALSYLAVLYYFYRNIHTTLERSLTLQGENVELVRELRAQKEEAEQANMAKSRFLAAASHDLRQPLHAQGLFLGELRERLHDPDCRPILESLDASTEAVRRLLNQLLDISRLDAGAVKVDLQDFPIDALLDGLTLDFSLPARRKGLDFRVVSCRLAVRSDPTLLRQIVGNLLSNAIRYTPSGRVLLGCRRHGRSVRVEVWDTGIGIPKDQQRAVFREFHRLDPSGDTGEPGLGLGLAIAERSAKFLGHPLRVVSEFGKGSVFSIEVPLSATMPDPSPQTLSTRRDEADLSGRRVLVIEDDPAVSDGMHGLLTGWGCDVVVASSAEEALERALEWDEGPDAVIADYHLGNGGTGLEAVERIETRFQTSIPVIVITGDTSAEPFEAIAPRGYSFLHKPIHPDQLRSSLAEILTGDGHARP